jgi:HAD superfamily hydrolase (TIGR01549 family)
MIKTGLGEIPGGLKLLIFDLDGTIVHMDVDWARLKRELSDFVFEKTSERFDFKSINNDTNKVIEKYDLRRQLFKIIEGYEVLGAEKSEPIEETKEFIIKNFGRVKMAVFTSNTRKAANIALQRSGVFEKIDFLVAKEDVQRQKPDPEGLFTILEKFNVKGKEAIFIGDKEYDMQCGESAGIKTILV